jgi:uncharacterized protein YjiS (DUF1127 family)
MNARVAKEEIALLMPTTLSHYADEPRFGQQDNEPSLMHRLSAAVAWIADLPRRRSVIAELNELSDHELADIGLNRSELNRVFDPEFAANRTRTRGAFGRAMAA